MLYLNICSLILFVYITTYGLLEKKINTLSNFWPFMLLNIPRDNTCGELLRYVVFL